MPRRNDWLLIGLLGLATGCGSSDPFEYVPATGKMVYEDGSTIPLNGARIQFYSQDAPQAANAHPRAALATLNADSEFDAVTSHKYGDGLIPGKHKVVIQADAVQSGKPIFPASCNNLAETPLVVDTADLPLVIKVPKP